jgi:hypothetical protein
MKRIDDIIIEAYKTMLESAELEHTEPIEQAQSGQEADNLAMLELERPDLKNASLLLMQLTVRGHSNKEDALVGLLTRSPRLPEHLQSDSSKRLQVD